MPQIFEIFSGSKSSLLEVRAMRISDGKITKVPDMRQ
jgi:hypothetical protein